MTLLHHYRFENDVTDCVGGQHGVVTGSVTYPVGKLGNALTFTRSISNYITLPNTIINNLTDFSISCWINSTDIQTTTNYYFSLANTITADYITLGLSPTLGILVVLNAITYYNFPHTFANKAWYHIVVEREQTTLRVYINGVLINSVTCTNSVLTATGAIILGQEQDSVGGGFDPNQTLNGSLDDLRIYDHALSLNEVKELYQAKYIHYTFDTFEEPTTNLAASILLPEFSSGLTTGWVADSDITMSIVQEGGINCIKGVVGSTVLSTPSIWSATSLTVLPNTTYTLSITGRTLTPTTSARLYVFSTSTGTNLVWDTPSYPLNTGMQTVSATFTTGPSDVAIRFGVTLANSAVGHAFLFSKVQLEKKSYATPFTLGTRDGIVRDVSGQGKDITIEEAYTPRWVNTGKLGNGCYSYTRGTRIFTSSGITLGDTITVSCWGKANIYHSGDLTSMMLFCTDPASYTGLDLYFINNGTQNGVYWNFYDGAGNPFLNNSVVVPLPSLNVWHHYTVVNSASLNKAILYIDGVYAGEAIYKNSTQNNLPLCIGNVVLDTRYAWNGQIDDFRIYNSALTESEIKAIYETRASIDNKGTLTCHNLNETGYKPLILNYTTWENGQVGGIGHFIPNEDVGVTENYRVIAEDPWGKETVVWEARPDATSGPDGGWYTHWIAIDRTKPCRISTWVRRPVTGNGSFYLGTHCHPTQAIRRSDGVTDSNPYFAIRSSLDQVDWVLVVGHYWPAGSGTGSKHPDSGVYSVKQGRISDTSHYDFVFPSDATHIVHRSYLYYSTDTNTRQQWVYPRIDCCDGTEPSIAELLAGHDSRNFEYTKAMNGATKEPFRLGETVRAVDMPETIGFYSNFDSAWTYYNTTEVSRIAGLLRLTSTTVDPYITRTGLSIDPNKYKYLHIKYKYISGTVDNRMQFFFTNSTYPGWSESFMISPWTGIIDDGQWHEAIIDCSSISGWTTSNITGIRVDWAVVNNKTMEFEYLFMSSVPTETVTNPGPLNISEISECSITNGLLHWYPLNGDTLDYASRYDGVNYSALPTTRGYYFDGVATKYIRATTQTLNPVSLTLSSWVRKDAHSVGSYPIFLSFLLPYLASDNSSGFRVSYTSAIGQHNVSINYPNNLGEWYLLTATFHPDGVRFYVNGVYQGVNTYPCTSIANNFFDIGRHLGSDNYRINGGVADVRIYNRPLTAQEVQILYNTTNPNSETKVSLSENGLFVTQIKEGK